MGKRKFQYQHVQSSYGQILKASSLNAEISSKGWIARLKEIAFGIFRDLVVRLIFDCIKDLELIQRLISWIGSCINALIQYFPKSLTAPS